MEQHADEGGSDAGVSIEGFRDGLRDDGLGVGAILGAVEAVEELRVHHLQATTP